MRWGTGGGGVKGGGGEGGGYCETVSSPLHLNGKYIDESTCRRKQIPRCLADLH